MIFWSVLALAVLGALAVCAGGAVAVVLLTRQAANREDPEN